MNTSTRFMIAASTLLALTACGDYSGTFGMGVSNQAKVKTVTINPPSPTMQVGQTLTMTAVLLSQNGDTLTNHAVVWTSSNTQVATVASNTGSVFAVAAGAVFITATVSGDTVSGQTILAITTAANMVHR